MKNFIGIKIKEFEIIGLNQIKIILTDESSYQANLESFNDIYCYPKNINEWNQAKIGENKVDIEWATGFAVHLDQIANLAIDQNKSA